MLHVATYLICVNLVYNFVTASSQPPMMTGRAKSTQITCSVKSYNTYSMV